MARALGLAAGPDFPLTILAQNASTASDRRSPMHRCLFLDDVQVDQSQGLEVRGHPAKRFPGNPLMVKRYPWANTRLQLYGHDIVYNPERRLYQMFYLAQPNPTPWPNVTVGWCEESRSCYPAGLCRKQRWHPLGAPAAAGHIV